MEWSTFVVGGQTTSELFKKLKLEDDRQQQRTGSIGLNTTTCNLLGLRCVTRRNSPIECNIASFFTYKHLNLDRVVYLGFSASRPRLN